MVRVVVRRPQQLGHAGVGDDEVLPPLRFRYSTREQHAGVADDESPGSTISCEPGRPHRRHDDLGEARRDPSAPRRRTSRPSPPPMSRYSSGRRRRPPAAARAARAARSMPSRTASSRDSCEPTCMSSPRSVTFGSDAATSRDVERPRRTGCRTCGPSRRSGCTECGVSTVTSGFTRSATGATMPRSRASRSTIAQLGLRLDVEQQHAGVERLAQSRARSSRRRRR